MSDAAASALPVRSPLGTVRVALVVIGLALLGLAAAGSASLFERAFSSDRHIAEVAYLQALRAFLAAVGLGLLGTGLLAGPRTLLSLLMAGVALAVCLFGLEGALRLHAWLSVSGQVQTPTGLRRSELRGLPYENTPDFWEDGDKKFNSFGMRDEDRRFDAAHPKVVVVGDSIESWRALPVRALYPRLLEGFLRESGRPYDVVNLGVTGYSIAQKVTMLKERGLTWNPDLVVVGYCLNDPIPAWELVRYFVDQTEVPAPKSLLLNFVNGRVRSLLHGLGVDFYHAIHAPGTDSWVSVKHAFRDLGRLEAARKVPIVLVVFPLMGDTMVDYPWKDIHSRVTAAARRSGLVVVDLLPRYQAAGFSAVRADGVHPNAAGHLLAAEAIYATVERQALLDGRQGTTGSTETSSGASGPPGAPVKPYSYAPMSGAFPVQGRWIPALFGHEQARSTVIDVAVMLTTTARSGDPSCCAAF